MSSIFVVKHGAFKAYLNPPDGDEHVAGFHFPGEVMGLDGIADEQYQCDMIALDDAQVCKVSLKDFESVSAKFPALQREIISVSSRSITAAQRMLLLIAKRPTEERLIMFLLSISQRFRHVGMPSKQFRLPMTHHDIANYLGMAPETISRQFKRLQKMGLISVKGRIVTINDIDQLRHQISEDDDSKQCRGILAKSPIPVKI